MPCCSERSPRRVSLRTSNRPRATSRADRSARAAAGAAGAPDPARGAAERESLRSALVQHPTRPLVSLDAGIDESAVRAALPASTEIQIVGIVRGVDESWTTLHETPSDLLVVGCS